MNITAFALHLPLKVNVKHASAERKRSDSIIVEIERNGSIGLGEGCPRPYVTGESIASALLWISENQERVARECSCIEDLVTWISGNEATIDRCPAAWCAVELALLDLFAKEKDLTVEELLGLDSTEGTYQYTAVVGDAEGNALLHMLKVYQKYDFRDYKFKINGNIQQDREKIRLLQQLLGEQGRSTLRVRLDANNLWDSDVDECQVYLQNWDESIYAIEEPLKPRRFSDLSHISMQSGVFVILDESVCNLSDLDSLTEYRGKWIVNVRVSKMGGILRSLDFINKCKALGLRVIVGAQVGETSILSRAALLAAKEAEEFLVAQEGAWGTLLLEEDYVEPVIMFGPLGKLSYARLPKEHPNWIAGFGLKKKETS